MTPLRKRMMDELQLRNLSPKTAHTYIRSVERFARYFNQSPARLGAEQVREYLLHLVQDKKVVANTLLVNRAALKFLYVSILKQKWFDEEIAHPKRRPTLPRVAISNGRLLEMHDGHVTFRWRDSANGNQQKLLTLDAIEFIRRFRLHILPPGFVKIRHFGFLAHPHRRSALLLCRKLLHAPASPTPLTDIPQKPVEHRCHRRGIGTLCFLGWIPAGAVSDLPVFLPVFVDSS
jgi:hypothetical protein